MNSKRNLDKDILYAGVKNLVEFDSQLIHLHQPKLYTLFSIAFQYLLFTSTKNPGHYILRIEDSLLADKLARKAKDESTRKFLQKLLIPRRFAYGKSTFHLDYFNLNSWGVTKDLPPERVQAALLIKNTIHNPLIEETDYRQYELSNQDNLLGKHFYLNSLTSFVPKVLMICIDENFDLFHKLSFPFITEKEESFSGVMISPSLRFTDEES